MGRGMVEIFKSVEDPRKGNAKKHLLEDVLTIATLATLCDCTQFTEMELFGKEREEWLKTFLTLENGIPSHDTFGDVFSAINPEQFREGFMEWVETIREKISNEVVAIDGKTICGSRDVAKNKVAIHIVSAWAAENGLVLGEIATTEKGNEITVIPKLLKMLELTGCIITIDAIGTQKEIAKTIKEVKADYVLTVKENQPTLLQDISLFFNTEKNTCDYCTTIEKSHGRIEKRECYATTDISWLPQRKDWSGLCGIAMLKSTVQEVGTEVSSVFVQYLIYSKADMSASQIM